MKNLVELNTLINVIKKHDNIAIYPHINADADAIGSSTALSLALNSIGKNTYIVCEEDVAHNLSFMVEHPSLKLIYANNINNLPKNITLSIAVDCSDEQRIATRIDSFLNASETMCIDHHRTSKYFCDYNYVFSNEAATGQLIYKIIEALEIDINKEIANRIFASILTDTGGFRYSNTQKESHLIVAKLYEFDLDSAYVATKIYDNDRIQKLYIETLTFENLVVMDELALCHITEDMLDKAHANMDETGGIIARLRSIAGIEVACLLKEYGKNNIKVSLRSKEFFDVATFSQRFGGGGHIRAAGFTLNLSMEESLELVKLELKKALDEAIEIIQKRALAND